LDHRIIGHAWVVVDGHPIIDQDADLVQFSPALFFGSEGVPVPAHQQLD
jgi:hypothetical protein